MKEKIIEAILFWKGEPVAKKKLMELASLEANELENALKVIEQSLENRGLILQRNGDEVMLGTTPDAGKIIEELTKEELSKELTKAALETLSVVLYLAPVRRSQIDYVRGVNSQFSLRHLEIRGLVEKTQSEEDARVYLYRPSFDCLSYLGINEMKNLPEFTDIKERLVAFEKSKQEEQDGGSDTKNRNGES